MEEKIQSWDIDITIEKLTNEDKKELQLFSCGNKELDKFFHKEVFICSKYHYVSAYCAKDKTNKKIVAVFTLSNDAVVLSSSEDLSDFMQETIPKVDDEYLSTFKKQTSFPAINIGHLGVRADLQNKGIGKQILDFILYTFSSFTTLGCQFITVDSLNNKDTNNFYMRNGFCIQTNNDSQSPTRRMYFLLTPYILEHKGFSLTPPGRSSESPNDRHVKRLHEES